MRYIFAILVPPLALFICGRPIQGFFNLIVWLISLPLLVVLGIGAIVWAFCTIHALIVCVSYGADKRLNRVVAAIEGQSKVQGT